MVAMGGGLGLNVDLARVPVKGVERDDILLFSESAGRFIVTIDPAHREVFENIFKGSACACIGKITTEAEIVIKGMDNGTLVSASVRDLKSSWQKPFGDLI